MSLQFTEEQLKQGEIDYLVSRANNLSPDTPREELISLIKRLYRATDDEGRRLIDQEIEEVLSLKTQ